MDVKNKVSSVLTKGKNSLVTLIIVVAAVSLIDLKVVIGVGQGEPKHSFQYKFKSQPNSVGRNVKKDCPTEPTIRLVRNGRVGMDQDFLPHFFVLAEDEKGKVIQERHDGLISLCCEGSQAITWRFKGRTNVTESIKTIDIKRSSGDPRNSSTFCYTTCINITMPRPNKFAGAGLFTCSYVGSEKDKKSWYIYGNDNLPNFIARLDGSNFIKTKSFSMDEVVVPCLGNAPNMTIALTKESSNGTYEHLDESKFDILYNAKIGATITKKVVNDTTIDLYGNYKCQTDDTAGLRNDFVSVRVEYMAGKPEKSEKMAINVDNGKCQRFVCSSKFKSHSVGANETDGNKLDMFVIKCLNPIQCQFSLGFLEYGTEPLPKFDGEPVDNSCGDKWDASRSHDYETMSIKIKAEYKAGVVVCRTRDMKHYQYSQFFRNVEPEGIGDAVILNPSNELSSDFKAGMRTEASSSTMNASSLISLEISPTMFVNNNYRIICETSNYLFANGTKWLVKYFNGSYSIPQILKSGQHYVFNDLRTEITTQVNITTKEIVAFVCLAPLWNSDQWINRSFPVTVDEGVLPQFVETTADHVPLYDTDTNITLVCEAAGYPAPIVSWYKNGEPYEDNTQNAHVAHFYPDSNTSRSELHFKNVTFNAMNIGGIYVCNASNIRGTVEYPIQISVTAYTTMYYWLPIVFTILLLSVVILGLYLLKFWKKARSQARYIHQLSKQDIDEFRYGRWSVKTTRGRTDSVWTTTTGLSDFANISGGVDSALNIPFDTKRYEINENELFIDRENKEMKLGEGNFAEVFKATLLRCHTNVTVAVKVLRDSNSDGSLFLKEIKILAYIGKHDHVVNLIGAVLNFKGGNIQMVMEYCAEGSLKSFLERKKHLFINEVENDGEIHYREPIRSPYVTGSYVKLDFGVRTFDLVQWAYQFALGMEYIASLKIIHGDLAARNLLITDTRQLKISDLGLAKKLKSYQRNYIPSLNSPALEQPWKALSPECLEENNQLSTESDVWAFGVTIWEIFSLGAEPYQEYPFYTADFLRRLREGYILDKPTHATLEIYEFMKCCWELKPHDRPTFSMLVGDFKNLLPGNYVRFYQNDIYQLQPRANLLNQTVPPTVFSPGYVTTDQLEQFRLEE